MQFNKKSVLGFGSATVLLCSFLAAGAIAGGAEEPPAAIPASLLIKAIDSASKAQPGYIIEAEVERKNGQIQVDVEVLTAEGEKYEVTVEAETSKVLLIEKDGDQDEENTTADDGGKDAFGKERGDN